MCPAGSALGHQTRKQSNLRSAFDVLDVDRDGKISHNDLRTFYGGFLSAGTSKDDVIGCMISVADGNKDGFVEYDEFEKVVIDPKISSNGRRWSLMEDVFRVMDKDGDGKVGHEDLKAYLCWAGFDSSDEDVKAMIRLGGGDQNGGGVSYECLLKILAV